MFDSWHAGSLFFSLCAGELEFGTSKEFAERNQRGDDHRRVYNRAATTNCTSHSPDSECEHKSTEYCRESTGAIQYKYTCGKAPTTEQNEIEITTSGVADAMASSFQVTYGTSYPVEPDIVYPQATQTCSSNPQCANLGFRSGNCCPNDDGVYNDCCSFCSIRPSCQGFASSSDTMCCPTVTDIMQPCCSERVAQKSPPPLPPDLSPPPPPPEFPPPPPAFCASGDHQCVCAQKGQGSWADTEDNCKHYYVCSGSSSSYQPCGLNHKFSQANNKCELATFVRC
eukprot:jgi/Picre1/30408/NNA_005772.t1